MMDILKKVAILEIDPYRAVDLLGKRWLTFNQPETEISAKRILNEFFSGKSKTDQKRFLDYLKRRHG